VHPFDDPDVIAGQGTVAMEILRQHQGPLDAVFVAIGGGGLISPAWRLHQGGAARGEGHRRADERLRRHAAIGARGQARHAADVGLFSDGTAVKLVGEETFRIVARELVDDFVVVDTDEVCAAIKDVFQDTRSIVEPAGAMGVAAIKQYVATRHKDQGRDLRHGDPAAPT
jgi:threonine dehydratase